MTSLTTSSENVFKGSSEKRTTLLIEGKPDLTDRSPTRCDPPMQETNDAKEKKRKSTIFKNSDYKRPKWIHSTKVETQEERDKYNEQQRKWRADCSNNPIAKGKRNQYRKKTEIALTVTTENLGNTTKSKETFTKRRKVLPHHSPYVVCL